MQQFYFNILENITQYIPQETEDEILSGKSLIHLKLTTHSSSTNFFNMGAEKTYWLFGAKLLPEPVVT